MTAMHTDAGNIEMAVTAVAEPPSRSNTSRKDPRSSSCHSTCEVTLNQAMPCMIVAEITQAIDTTVAAACTTFTASSTLRSSTHSCTVSWKTYFCWTNMAANLRRLSPWLVPPTLACVSAPQKCARWKRERPSASCVLQAKRLANRRKSPNLRRASGKKAGDTVTG